MRVRSSVRTCCASVAMTMSIEISPQAIVSPRATLGDGVSIGPWTLVHDNVVIGADVSIEGHCEIGHPTPLAGGLPLSIGDGALIRSHSIFYEGSTFGPGLVTGHRVTVRERFEAGRNLQIGTLCDFQGHAKVGDYVRTHSSVHIGQGTEIGDFVWVFPYTVFTNDPHPPSDVRQGIVVEEFAVVTTMVTVLPGVRIGARSLVGAHSLVTRDVPPDSIAAGVPAKVVGPTGSIKLRDSSGRPAYPWTSHFRRGYPPEATDRWDRD